MEKNADIPQKVPGSSLKLSHALGMVFLACGILTLWAFGLFGGYVFKNQKANKKDYSDYRGSYYPSTTPFPFTSTPTLLPFRITSTPTPFPEITTSCTERNGPGSSSTVVKIRDKTFGKEYFYPMDGDLKTLDYMNFDFIICPNGEFAAESITPYVYAQNGTWEEFKTKAFFPEDSYENVVFTTHRVISKDAVLVEPSYDAFPSESQIVLSFSLSQNSGYIYRIFTK